MTRVFFLISLLLAGSALATERETHFVTDQVIAPLFRQPAVGAELVERLPTGTPLEVLDERNGYLQVRTAEGLEGWLGRRYVSGEIPAQMLLLRVAGELEFTRERLASLEQERAGLEEQLAERRVPLWALGLFCGIFALVGFLFGVAWLDRRIRERHGGFRV